MTSATPVAPELTDAPPRRIGPVWIVCLLLGYSAATQYAVASGIDRLVVENADFNHFASAEGLVTFLRVGVVVWSITASFLQALVLRLIYMGIVKGSAPTLGTSWFWVLVGQVPFMLTVLAMGLFFQSGTVGLLGQAWTRILFGVVAAAIYVVAAKKASGAPNWRLALFGVVVAIINSVLLVAGISA